ncbi:MAG: hypothetical protein FWE12_00750 [Oscillospiraceae bacterium]|nr:hypothetical protein [Oscillospiraceae bacterium]
MLDERAALEQQTLDSIPKSQKIFGNTVYWVAIWSAIGAFFVPIFILLNPTNNILNPNTLFGAIFAGASPEEVWGYSVTGSFPGAHFYIDYITKADSWAMLLIAIGCGFGLFGLVPAVLYQVKREKDWFCAILGTIIAVLTLLSVVGILRIEG